MGALSLCTATETYGMLSWLSYVPSSRGRASRQMAEQVWTPIGRDPTDQQRSWLVSKIRTDLAMKEIKLNAPVMIKNLQSMLEKSLELECLNTRRLSNPGRSPGTGGYNDRLVGWRMW